MKQIAYMARLSWRYLWSRPLGAALNVLLLSLGLASITLVLLVAAQLNQAFERDLAGIDVVVGAKGSPHAADSGGRVPHRHAHRQRPLAGSAGPAAAPAGGAA